MMAIAENNTAILDSQQEDLFIFNWVKHGDKLDRAKECSFLTKYLIEKFKDTSKKNTIEESFVLNINADWGFGKTYFLEKWSEELRSIGYPVLLFNAWNSDYYNDPLTAFMSEIQDQLEPYYENDNATNQIFKEVKKFGYKMMKNGLPILVSIIAKKFTGYTIEQLMDIFDESDKNSSKKQEEIENAISEIFKKSVEESIQSYRDTKKTITNFKDELKKLIKTAQDSDNVKAPLFIFIDELDRCRPTYAIEVLEKIKHIFGITGVYFIIATASNQLCHSIKSIYGHGFNAEGYLKRFFDQIYELKRPDYLQFTEFVYEKFNFKNHENILFSPPLGSTEFAATKHNIELIFLYCAYFKLGLRDQIQIIQNLYTICLTWSSKRKLHLGFMLLLLIMKHKDDNLFNEFESTLPSQRRIDTPIDNFLRINVDMKLGVKEFDYSKPDQIIKTNPYEIIMLYVSSIHKTLNDYASSELRGANNLEGKISQEIYSTGSSQKHDHSEKDVLLLRSYFSHVRQLGQFKEGFIVE